LVGVGVGVGGGGEERTFFKNIYYLIFLNLIINRLINY
jgi:hypothetical protein